MNKIEIVGKIQPNEIDFSHLKAIYNHKKDYKRKYIIDKMIDIKRNFGM